MGGLHDSRRRLNGLGFGGDMRYLGSTYSDAANTIKVPDVI
jgi:outer membrane receptor protein involved in Fe transport